jgi:polysaccharide biosynthesis protein PslH
VKILFISLFLPHPKATHAGGRYVYEMLRHLSRNHEVDLATRHEEDEAPLLADLHPFCKSIYPHPYSTAARRGLLDNLGLIGNYLGFSRFADRLIADGDYDLVQVEWVEAAVLISRRSIPMLLDAHDVITKPAERSFTNAVGVEKLFPWLIYRFIRFVECLIARRFDAVLTRSEYDSQYLRKMLPTVRSVVIPHPAGLDLKDSPNDPEGRTILFLASYKYRPVNVAAALWFYREVFPLVQSHVPDARFVIAGYGPPAELTALTADPQVAVTGFVDDLDRCYKEAAVFVAPILTGGGIIVKVLDALAAATPTVATTFANEGVGAVPGRDLLVADAPEDFAAAVVKLLLDREYATRLGKSGRDFVRGTFGCESVMARLDAVHEDLVKNYGNSP